MFLNCSPDGKEMGLAVGRIDPRQKQRGCPETAILAPSPPRCVTLDKALDLSLPQSPCQ